ncbi:hypothetical protein [Streptomyces sp. 900105245]
MTARYRRCGHGTGPLHPGDQKAVAEFTAMLAARQRPAPWTGRGDAPVRIDEHGLARGRSLPTQQPEASPIVPVLHHPDHALAGPDLPPGTDLRS